MRCVCTPRGLAAAAYHSQASGILTGLHQVEVFGATGHPRATGSFGLCQKQRSLPCFQQL